MFWSAGLTSLTSASASCKKAGVRSTAVTLRTWPTVAALDAGAATLLAGANRVKLSNRAHPYVVTRRQPS